MSKWLCEEGCVWHGEKAAVTQCLWRGEESNGGRETVCRLSPPFPSLSAGAGLPAAYGDPDW